MTYVGCDVSSEWVDISSDGKVERVKREREALLNRFKGMPPSRVLMEPTGRYHRLVVECARKAGHEVKLVDPYAFSLYRRSLKPRASTDRICALILERFARNEWDIVPEYKPMSEPMQRLKDLLELRETHVELRVALQQSLGGFEKPPAACKRALHAMERAVAETELAILVLVKKDELYAEFLRIDGVGPATAAALVWLFRAFRFVDSDQVVAFIGLDVRVRESGKFKDKRKLTKRGPTTFRHLLYCAANSLRCSAHYKPLFARHHAKGLRTKAVNVIVARRILRVAFEVAVHGVRFDRSKFYSP